MPYEQQYNRFSLFHVLLGILKKKSSPSLEPVPEFAESHEIQRADSNLEIVESEVNIRNFQRNVLFMCAVVSAKLSTVSF